MCIIHIVVKYYNAYKMTHLAGIKFEIMNEPFPTSHPSFDCALFNPTVKSRKIKLKEVADVVCVQLCWRVCEQEEALQ